MEKKPGLSPSLRDTIIDHEGRQIWPIMDSNGDSDTPEAEANYRLIYAAPDLLAALVMVRDADDDCHRDGLPTIPGPARGKIDAAIAKATGAEGGRE